MSHSKLAWAVENGELDKRLAEPRQEYGAPPNIIHYMWDDQPPMAFGDPIYQKIRGYETPNLNKLAREGMILARMCTEPGCTPSRAACLTGQLAIRTGHYGIVFPIEYTGLAAENVTLAEVQAKVGYATGFFDKLYLGDIEARKRAGAWAIVFSQREESFRRIRSHTAESSAGGVASAFSA